MNQKYCFFFLLLFASSFWLNAQTSSNFPKDWQGIWRGDLAVYNAQGLAQTVPMELHILPTDSTHRFTWTIIYGADKEAGKRPYELVVIDAEKGHYAVGEKNSIVLDGYFFQNKFFSRFEVQNTLLLSTQQLVGEDLIFEIIAGNMEAINTTGDEVVQGDTIPPVRSFPVKVMQRGVLRREK